MFLLFFLFSSMYGDELTVDPPAILQTNCNVCAQVLPPFDPSYPNIVVDLIDPIYQDGVLTTEHGGVLSTLGLRIQAQKITYIKKLNEEAPIFTVACEGNVLIDYKEWALVGDSFYYDFAAQKGSLLKGRTAIPPWYIGGREILLDSDGSLTVLDGFVTTSEGEVEDVVLRSPCIILTTDRILTAKHVHLCVNELPIFWLPYLEFDLKTIERSPFALKFGWGGFLGSYVSLLYRFLSYKDFRATARLDAFFGKGIGIGIETAYNPCWRPTQFYTRNYYAHDIPLYDPTRKNRYRFQGTYADCISNVVINGQYDFVSDAQMAADYTNKDFNLPTAGRTELELRKKENRWIASLFTRVRVNDFQSVNQELPTFDLNLHPIEIAKTGIMFENHLKASYLDYVFSDEVVKAKDFSSARIELTPFFYRPLFFGPLVATPQAGLIAIAYSNSPDGGSKGQAVGKFGLNLETTLTKNMGLWKHHVEPYLNYCYLTHPSISTDAHYIFTIADGLNRLNQLRFGVRSSLFRKLGLGFTRQLWIDLWANAFFDTHTIAHVVPKGYLTLEWMPFACMFIGLESAWNFQEKRSDFYNMRIDWTISENFAVGIEYRHRSPFDWRKANFYNFILESTRSQSELLLSPLSDRRDTLLLRFFYRWNPNWTAKLDLRHGWHREFQDPYLEYQIDLSRIIFQHWRLSFNYERREADNRYSFSLLMNPGPPYP